MTTSSLTASPATEPGDGEHFANSAKATSVRTLLIGEVFSIPGIPGVFRVNSDGFEHDPLGRLTDYSDTRARSEYGYQHSVISAPQYTPTSSRAPSICYDPKALPKRKAEHNTAANLDYMNIDVSDNHARFSGASSARTYVADQGADSWSAWDSQIGFKPSFSGANESTISYDMDARRGPRLEHGTLATTSLPLRLPEQKVKDVDSDSVAAVKIPKDTC